MPRSSKSPHSITILSRMSRKGSPCELAVGIDDADAAPLLDHELARVAGRRHHHQRRIHAGDVGLELDLDLRFRRSGQRHEAHPHGEQGHVHFESHCFPPHAFDWLCAHLAGSHVFCHPTTVHVIAIRRDCLSSHRLCGAFASNEKAQMSPAWRTNRLGCQLALS